MLPRLQAIVDVDAAVHAGWRPGTLARAFLDGGARFLQIRAKTLTSRDLLALADAVVDLAGSYEARVIVNDRADIARMARAHGVHVGQDDLPPGSARTLLGGDAVVGFSTHTLAQVQAAAAEPVTYIAVGPIFGTATKETGYTAVGTEMVRHAVAQAAGMPIVAIGGITLERAPAVIEAGASMVAVIGDLLSTGDPGRRVAEYCVALR